MNPEISVIIPIYNVEKYLDRCLKSVLEQSFSNIEILLVDDGSTDRSGAMCDEYEKKDNRIRVIHKQNGGQSTARNLGIDEAKGRYIGFVDSDDYIDKDMYEYLYNCITKENADVSMCGLYDCFAGREPEIYKEKFYQVTDRIEAIRIVMESKITSVTPVNKLYKKELFDDLKFIEGITAEDARLMIDLLAKCERVVVSNLQKYYYFHRAGSTTTKPLNKRDYDVIDVYEYNKKRCLEISPSLSSVALLRQCWARFYMLDKMALSDGKYDKKREDEYIKFLRQNKSFIMHSDVFTRGRKISFLALLTSKNLYKKIVRKNTERAKSVNA